MEREIFRELEEVLKDQSFAPRRSCLKHHSCKAMIGNELFQNSILVLYNQRKQGNILLYFVDSLEEMNCTKNEIVYRLQELLEKYQGSKEHSSLRQHDRKEILPGRG